MSPISAYTAEAMLKIQAHPRAVGERRNHTTASYMTPSEGNALQILALVFSTFSVLSAILAASWFIKMRRSFRHDLIMLLIQSDMFKALWFMIYPIVTFTKGPVLSSSKFCQVDGFFLLVGIEASDFSVLMIAIHSALYIFKPRSSSTEGGLYPYRRTAYALYVIFPLLMASLAFINPHDSYVTDGTYCYLPVRPFWYRLALSWIPRYFIFLIILGIYASIYFYVRYKFHGFTKGSHGETSNDDSSKSQNIFAQPVTQPTLPTTPQLAYHGLIPISRRASHNDADGIKRSISPNQPPRPISDPHRKNSVHHFMWTTTFTSADEPSFETPPSELSVTEADSLAGHTSPHPLSLPSPIILVSQESHPKYPNLVQPSTARTWSNGFLRRFSPTSTSSTGQCSTTDVYPVLSANTDGSETAHTPLPLELVNSRGQNFADAEMLRARDKIRRQLRFLFIYPLVYIGMWIIPFVSHIMQYNDHYAVNSPFVLVCITTISMCAQAAVDCWLFSTREKPWRHIPDTSGGFWESLKFWSGWHGVRKKKVTNGPGKTREEMVREARAAYRRRDHELAQRRTDAGDMASSPTERKVERSWWDSAGHHGAADIVTMSPVAEEIPNPMEQAIAGHEKIKISIPETDSSCQNSETITTNRRERTTAKTP